MSDQVVITEAPTTVIVDDGTGDIETVVVTSESVTVVDVGIQGPPGPPGASGDKFFMQAFTSASSVTVTHGLGKFPSVTIVDTAEDEIIGDVQYIDNNNAHVSFSAPTSGVIYCN